MNSNTKSKKKAIAISTIITVAMLIVALSTATYAWYSTNNKVNTDSLIVTSANSSSASLAIDRTMNLSSQKSSISLELTSATSGSVPMIPRDKPVAIAHGVTPTQFANFISGDADKGFNACEVNNAGNFTGTVNTGVVPMTIAKANNETQVHNDFWVINTSGEEAGVNVVVNIQANGCSPVRFAKAPTDAEWAAIKADTTKKYYKSVEKALAGGDSDILADEAYSESTTYYISNANIASHLRVAVFNGGELVNIWSLKNTDAVQYGVINSGTDSKDTSFLAQKITPTQSGAEISLGTIPARSGIQIQLAVWFDGDVLDNADMSSSALFTVNFAENSHSVS